MSYTPPTNFDSLTDDANENPIRYYAVDYDAGSDNNIGYSDIDLATAGTVAKKTIEGLSAIFPRNGNGRIAVVAIKARAAGAVYRNVADNADASLDFLAGVQGYKHVLVRGTRTDTTAGVTAFDNSDADKIHCGGQVVSGTSATGYEPTGVPTSSVFTCQITGGGAPGFAVEPALQGKRIRFDAATATAALRNVCATIHRNTTDTITVGNNLPATPALTDVFYIEEPGVAFDSIRVKAFTGDTTALPPSFSSVGLTLAGIRSPNTGGSHVGLLGTGVWAQANLTFIDLASPAFVATRWLGGYNLSITQNYVDETNTTRLVGAGLLQDGWGTISGLSSLVISNSVTRSGRHQIISIGGGSFSVGAACVFGVGPLFQNCRGSGATQGSIGGNNIGNNASSTIRRMRCVGSFVGASVSVTNCETNFRGGEIEEIGTAAAIALLGLNTGMAVNDLVGSSGNTGSGILMSGVRYANVLLGQLNANTWTSTASPSRQIEMADTRYYSFADAARNDLVDTFQNKVQGAGSRTIGTAIDAINNAVGDIAQYSLVRTTGEGLVQAAQADTFANASGVIGVCQRAFTAAGPQSSFCVISGATWVQFDSAPTIGGIAYLSPGTLGNATTTPPPLAATNQKLRLGIVHRTLAGNLGFVTLQPDKIPVTADGAA
jgi:hypothetical protein